MIHIICFRSRFISSGSGHFGSAVIECKTSRMGASIFAQRTVQRRGYVISVALLLEGMAKATSNLSVSDDSLAADVNKKRKRSCECTCLSPIDRVGLEIRADEELVQCQCRECGLVDERTKVRRCNAKVIRETRAAFGPLCDECKDYHGSVPLILLFRAARKACDRERNRSTGAFPI